MEDPGYTISSLFAILTHILFISALKTNILIENRKRKLKVSKFWKHLRIGLLN